jgi:hypothetical protein
MNYSNRHQQRIGKRCAFESDWVLYQLLAKQYDSYYLFSQSQ